MGQNKTQIDKVAQQFVRKIRKQFSPSKIILFGSRARRDFFEYSDYDFIIVAPAFEGMHWLDRISKIMEHWNSDKPIDVLPYTQKEFELKKKWSSTVKAAVNEGVVV